VPAVESELKKVFNYNRIWHLKYPNQRNL
jgi:hypothetical protein